MRFPPLEVIGGFLPSMCSHLLRSLIRSHAAITKKYPPVKGGYFSVVTVGLEPTSATSLAVTPHCGDHSLSVEKAADEIPSTGGHRRLSTIDVNDVLAPYADNDRSGTGFPSGSS
jgi:hypothetical protein